MSKNEEQMMSQGDDFAEKNNGLMPLVSDSFYISWLGSVGATNSTVVETVYNGGQLKISVVVTGTPTPGVACNITVVPLNCEFESGKAKESFSIWGANLGLAFFDVITPKSTYKGKTVKFSVSISSEHKDAVLYANGYIG